MLFRLLDRHNFQEVVPKRARFGRNFLEVVAIMVVAGLGLAGCTSSPSAAPVLAQISVIPVADRAAAPVLSAELIEGGTFKLADHLGEVVVVNFWASWCGPCHAEADDLEHTYQATKATKVTFLGINIRDDLDAAKSFLVGRSTYPNIFDPKGKVALSFKVPPTAVPSTIIIDREGRVAAVTPTPVIQDMLQPAVTQIAAESSHG